MTKTPVHIVVETGSLAGGVRVIGELANRLVKRDWPVSIWSVNPVQTLTNWFQLDHRVKWHSFLRTGTIQDYQQLQVVLSKQPGYKMGTFWRTAFVAAECAKEGEGLYLIQDVETSYTSQPVVAERVMATYALPLKRITTSRWVESQIKDCHYIGIGLDNFYRPNEKMVRDNFVLACARVQALKGWDVLCEVARYIQMGRGRLVTYGIESGIPMLAQHKHFSKPKDADVRRMYQETGVFLSTSRHEGFNLTALEAMACGAPVVTTDSDGNREYILPDENCLVSGDPFQLAELCAQCINNRELAKRLGKAGIETAARYNWRDVIDRLENIL